MDTRTSAGDKKALWLQEAAVALQLKRSRDIHLERLLFLDPETSPALLTPSHSGCSKTIPTEHIFFRESPRQSSNSIAEGQLLFSKNVRDKTNLAIYSPNVARYTNLAVTQRDLLLHHVEFAI